MFSVSGPTLWNSLSLQQEIQNLNIALTAVASSVKQIPAVSAQAMAGSVINQPTVQPRINTGTSAETTSRDARHVTEDRARGFPAVYDENNSRRWASTVETSSPVPDKWLALGFRRHSPAHY